MKDFEVLSRSLSHSALPPVCSEPAKALKLEVFNYENGYRGEFQTHSLPRSLVMAHEK